MGSGSPIRGARHRCRGFPFFSFPPTRHLLRVIGFSRLTASSMRCREQHRCRVSVPNRSSPRRAVVSLTDLHVEDDLFCRAQDLLLLYDESPVLVRREELAQVVRGLLTGPHWSCADDPSITPTPVS